MKRVRIILVLFLFALLAACGDDGDGDIREEDVQEEDTQGEDTNEEAPALVSFSLSAEDNPEQIKKTVQARIGRDHVEAWVSAGVDRSALVAGFEIEGEELRLDDEPLESGSGAHDFSSARELVVRAKDGEERIYQLEVRELDELKNAVPHFYITTDDAAEIDTKESYLPGDLRVDGDGEYEDFEGRMGVRGRGNSTWGMPKKPFKIKLDEKDSILGLAAAKKWVLLANYIDGTLISNALSMKVGRLLEMPFTHHMIPVDVTVNGEYMGNYMLTEQKEVKKKRINVGDDGVLLELDSYFDEQYQFKSAGYQLPVMIKFPKLKKFDDAEEASEIAAEIQADFEAFEALVRADEFPESGYRDSFDIRALADYLIVFYVSANRELNHPKSVYLYQKAGEPYRMGPIWDFDWAFGYNTDEKAHFVHPEIELFWPGSTARAGTHFFTRFLEDPEVREAVQERWEYLKSEKYAALLEFLEGYAAIIRDSYIRDYEVWGQGSLDQDAEMERMFDWLDKRIMQVDNVVDAM